MEVPLRRGRGFDDHDRGESNLVAIVNGVFAHQAFGADDPIGRRVRLGRVDSTTPWLTVVGVIGDVRHPAIDGRPRPEISLPLAPAPASILTPPPPTPPHPPAPPPP